MEGGLHRKWPKAGGVNWQLAKIKPQWLSLFWRAVAYHPMAVNTWRPRKYGHLRPVNILSVAGVAAVISGAAQLTSAWRNAYTWRRNICLFINGEKPG